MCNFVETTEFSMPGSPPSKRTKTVFRCEVSAEKVRILHSEAKSISPILFADTITTIMEVMETGVEIDLPYNPGTIEEVTKEFKDSFESFAKDAESAPDSDASMTGYWIIKNPLLVAGIAMVVKTWAQQSVEEDLSSLLTGSLDPYCFQRKMEDKFQPFLEANIRNYWDNN